MTPTTYWILGPRESQQHLLAVLMAEPAWTHERWDNVTCADFFHTPKRFWPALGLPHEPAPGECWEVQWEERWTFRDDRDAFNSRMVPIARNVTAELKEKADEP